MTLPTQAEIELPLLKEIMAAGGEARPAAIYPRMRKYFPEITDQDLQDTLANGGNKWINRIQWARLDLVQKDEIYRKPRGIWRITSKGRGRVEGISIPDNGGHGIGDDPRPTNKPNNPTPASKPVVTIVTGHVETLCENLLKAQQQSSTPKNFEGALARAFLFLGFDVRAQGKPGETDVVLDT